MKIINFKNFENKINILVKKAQSNAIKPLADKILGFIAMHVLHDQNLLGM